MPEIADPDASVVASYIPGTSVSSPWEILYGNLPSSDRLVDNYITQQFLPFYPGRVRWTRRLARLLLRAAYEEHERAAAAEHRLLLAQRAAAESSLRLQALLAQQQQQN